MSTKANRKPIFRDPTRSVDERADSLLRAMTLDEKIAQLGCVLAASELTEDTRRKSLPSGIGEIVLMGELMLTDPVTIAGAVTRIQKHLVEGTRLGIPAIFHIEALAGALFAGAVNFPIPLGLAATFRPDLVERMADCIRQQMIAAGFRQALSPVLDITRDPRWGRIGETFGEDPLLVSGMGVAYVRGLQTDRLENGVIATGKHFLGYGASEGALNTAAQHLNDRELREVYARPFEAAIQEAGLASIMNSYGEIDGIPIYASRFLLTDFLRGTLGFKGFVVSDYMAIDRLVSANCMAADMTEAGILSLEAGLDVELPVVNAFGAPLREAVKEGRIPMERIDASVRRVLEAKFRLGLFEHPYPILPDAGAEMAEGEERAISRRLAADSMVLLRNEGGLLPLRQDLRRLAVIGPNADSVRNLFGGYTHAAMADMFLHSARDGQGMMGVSREAFRQDRGTDLEIDKALRRMVPGVRTVLEALRDRVSPDTSIRFEEGCTVKGLSTEGFDRAVSAAAEADCAILVLGGKNGWGNSCTSGEGIDAASIGLPGVQEALLRRLHETGTPIVLVHLDGRPFSSPWAAEHIPAILEAFAPGQEGADAIADVLFGRTNPGGRLPVTIARSAGQIPVYYNHRNGSGYSPTFRLILEGYIDETADPLYCFGHGLSYTEFAYDALDIRTPRVASDGVVTVSFRVRNVGDRAGDETVQIYIRDILATVVRPVQELAGFRRISLDPSWTAVVTCTIDLRQLAFLDRDMQLVVEPGRMEVRVGSSSRDIRLKGEFEIVGPRRPVVGCRPFFPEIRVDRTDTAG